MKEASGVPAQRATSRRTGVILAVFVAAGLGYWLTPRPRGPAAPSPSAAASGAPLTAPTPPEPAAPAPLLPSWHLPPPRPIALVPFDGPGFARVGPEKKRHRTAVRGQEITQYPPWCRPAAEFGEAFLGRPTPVVRALVGTPSGPGRVVVRLSREHPSLGPGESAVLTIEAALDDRAVPLQVASASVTLTPPGPADPSVALAFRDDGAPPDTTRGDHEWTALLRAPRLSARELGGAPLSALVTTARVTVGDETNDVDFRVERNGTPPMRFTGHIQESVVDGDLTFDVGVEVARAGDYSVTGRLYDLRHRGLALLTAGKHLDPSTHSIALRAFGKLLRDTGVKAPFLLGDLDGWLDDPGRTPDRALVSPFRGPHRTLPVPLTALGEKTWSEVQLAAPRGASGGP